MLSLNRLELLEAHFGVPAARRRAVRHQHAARAARGRASSSSTAARRCCCSTPSSRPPRAAPSSCRACASSRLGPEYEALLESGRPAPPDWPDSEDRPIAVDYTSGTTGTPKGVVYTHRGAYLGALADLVETRLGPDSRYLWTLPMFHCNGWCFTWAVAGVGATSAVSARPEPAAVWRELRAGATHLCAAPTVLISAARARRCGAARPRGDVRRRWRPALADPDRALRGARHPAHPPVRADRDVRARGRCAAWPPEWNALPAEERARLRRARACRPCSAARSTSWTPRARRVPRDGADDGRGRLRGNTVMAGYLDDAGGDGGGVPRGLVPLGRRGGHAPGRPHRGARPLQGRDHLRRREHLDDRGRAGAGAAPGGARMRRRGRSRTTAGASARRRS